MAPAERETRITALRSLVQEGRPYSRSARRRYDRALLLRVRQGLSGARAQAPIVEAYRLASKLARERTELVHSSWADLLAQIRSSSRHCRTDAERRALSLLLPTERLYGPYYLALYRFYASLPDGLRMALITGLHGPNPTATSKTDR